ncbi:hypothetical protein BGW37DRAFT_103283 [Umbelopsis sp. PMI_123]|nr:hypothetical protein BGW37DRAFT_103283 [Umbelopsis sp. PMI_123]
MPTKEATKEKKKLNQSEANVSETEQDDSQMGSDVESVTSEALSQISRGRRKNRNRNRRKNKANRKSGLGLLDLDHATDAAEGVVDTVGNTANKVADIAGGVTNAIAGPERSDNKALRLRLDLNLDVEIELKARVHGDVTLALLR